MMNDNKSCNVRWKLHDNISRNSYGNVVIGSYGGCFEEDVWLMCRRTRGSSPTEFGCTSEVCITLNVSRRQCTTPKRLAKFGWWKCQKP